MTAPLLHPLSPPQLGACLLCPRVISCLFSHLRWFLSGDRQGLLVGLTPSSDAANLSGCGFSPTLQRASFRRLAPREPQALGLVGLTETQRRARPGFSSFVALGAGGGMLACGIDRASPPPLSWAPLAGNRRPRLTLTQACPQGWHLFRKGTPFPQADGEEAGGDSQRTPLCPQPPLAPAPLQCPWVPAQGKLQSGGMGRPEERQLRAEQSQPSPHPVSCPGPL